MRGVRWAGMLAVLIWGAVAAWNTIKPLPAGTRVASLTARLDDSQLEVIDEVAASRPSGENLAGQARAGRGSALRPEVMTRELALIDRADQLIVLDQTPLARDLGQHLLIRKREHPSIKIVVLADPLPEIYGGTPAHYLDSLERAGIVVARVRLDRLRDPLPWYSAIWRMGIGWWSDPYDETAPRAGLRASLRRANGKRDRRQLLVGDDGAGGWIAVVPAVGGGVVPAGAGGVSVAIAGGVARDMAASELKIAAWSTHDDRLPAAPAPVSRGIGSIDARFVSEGAIRAALVEAFSTAAEGDDIRVATPALSDRALLAAALGAAARGVHVRMLLDPGEAPNRAVAAELQRGGADRIDVRWSPAGALSSSLTIVRHRRELSVTLGAGDFTRLSLDDFNLSAAVDFRLQARATAAEAFIDAFEGEWSAAAATPPVDAAAPPADAPAYWRYRLLQWGGLAAY